MTDELYRIYDAHTRLLYVGVSWNALYRLQAHSNRAPWWFMADSWSIEKFPTRYLAEQAEMHAARKEGPLYNVVYGELFKSSAREAREAIPAHIERQPAPWREPNPAGVAPMPYRVNRWNWQGAVAALSAESAEALSRTLTGRRPELAEEFEAVPAPWGHHAVVARALLIGAVSVEEVRGRELAGQV